MIETGYLFKRLVSLLHGHTARPRLPALLPLDGGLCMVLANEMWGKVIDGISRTEP